MIMKRKVVGVLNLSKSCEPSAYLFHKAVAFLDANDYRVRFDSLEGAEVLILINSCCATILKVLAVKKTIDKALSVRGVKRVVIFWMPRGPRKDRYSIGSACQDHLKPAVGAVRRCFPSSDLHTKNRSRVVGSQFLFSIPRRTNDGQ